MIPLELIRKIDGQFEYLVDLISSKKFIQISFEDRQRIISFIESILYTYK